MKHFQGGIEFKICKTHSSSFCECVNHENKQAMDAYLEAERFASKELSSMAYKSLDLLEYQSIHGFGAIPPEMTADELKEIILFENWRSRNL